MKRKLKIFILLASVANAIIMVVLSFFLLNQPYMHGDEKVLVKYTSFLKTWVLGMEKKPSTKDFIFVNVAYDKLLIDRLDEFGFSVGNQVITDRDKLAQFFEILNTEPDSQKYVICDIFFKDTTPYDSMLGAQLKKYKKAILSYHFANDTTLDLPIFDVNKGLADYEALEHVFYKYNIMGGDTNRMVPLVMYEYLTKNKLEEGTFFSYLNDKPIFKNFILNLRIRNDDLFSGENRYSYVNLGEMLAMGDPEFVLDMVKNRIIVIGDFEDRDIHKSYVGPIPGPLIMLNAYLALMYGDNVIHLGFVLLLFIGFFVLSLLAFYPGDFIETWILSRYKKANKVMIFFISYMTLFMIISTTSYFIFDIHLSILYLSIYLSLIDFIIRRIYIKTEITSADGNHIK